MSNSATNLDLISVSQAQKEATANALFDSASPATVYGRRASTSGGLVWGFYGGAAMVGGEPVQIANGTLTLTASATNYVEADLASGAVSFNTAGFTAGRTRLYTIVTGAATVTNYTDHRVGVLTLGTGVTSVNGKTDAVTLTAADVGAEAAGTAAAALASHEAANDPHPQYLTQTEADARYASSAAAGVTSVNSQTGAVTLTAADVGAEQSGAAAAAIAAHEAAANPHPDYLTQAEADARYLQTLGAQPFDLTAFYPGILPASALVTRVPVARAVSFPAGLAGSIGRASAAATASAAFDVQKNGASVGTITFAAGALTATFAAANPVTLAAGDLISIIAPASADATLADVSFVLAGTR